MKTAWLWDRHINAFRTMLKKDKTYRCFLNSGESDLSGIGAPEDDTCSGVLGLFQGEELVAIARIGIDDDLVAEQSLPANSVAILSDVWVPGPERRCGYGKAIVREALRRAREFEPAIQRVNIDLLDIRLNPWYAGLGFQNDPEYSSVPEEWGFHMSQKL